MQRVTVRDLDRDLVLVNSWLAEAGADFRLANRPIKGGQAVNEYPINESGGIKGTAYIRPIGRGTSRECIAAAYRRYALYMAVKNRENMSDE